MKFRPYPVLTVFTLISLGVLVWLGNWQYGRFTEKMALDETEPDWQVLEGHVVPGSEVVVYAYADAEAAWRRTVAVDRGDKIVFVPVEVLYQIDPPLACAEENCGEGLKYAARGLYKTPSKKAPFASPDEPDKRIYYTFAPAMLAGHLSEANAARVSHEVFEPETVSIVADGQRRVGTNPFASLRPDDHLPPQRHFGYAITWWGLAMALVGVYLAFHYQQGRLRFRKDKEQ